MSGSCFTRIRSPHPQVMPRHHEPFHWKSGGFESELHLKMQHGCDAPGNSANHKRGDKYCDQPNFLCVKTLIGSLTVEITITLKPRPGNIGTPSKSLPPPDTPQTPAASHQKFLRRWRSRRPQRQSSASRSPLTAPPPPRPPTPFSMDPHRASPAALASARSVSPPARDRCAESES